MTPIEHPPIKGKVADIRPPYELGSDSFYPIALIVYPHEKRDGTTEFRLHFQESRTGNELTIGQTVEISEISHLPSDR